MSQKIIALISLHEKFNEETGKICGKINQLNDPPPKKKKELKKVSSPKFHFGINLNKIKISISYK